MNLENIIAISGQPGLFRLVAPRKNGLIAENFDTGKKLFYPSRKHQFTPLQTVAIYTITDATELDKIFEKMLAMEEIPSPGDSNQRLQQFFSQVLPDYDPDRVMNSDIKKVIKWFNFLKERNMLLGDEEE